MKKVFDALDDVKDGELEKEEVIEGFDKIFNIRLGETEMSRIVRQTDINGDGRIQFTEFMASGCDKDLLFTHANLRKAFTYFDMDQDGYIDAVDLKDVLRQTSECTPLEECDFRGDLVKIFT